MKTDLKEIGRELIEAQAIESCREKQDLAFVSVTYTLSAVACVLCSRPGVMTH